MFTVTEQFKRVFDRASVRAGVVAKITGAKRLVSPDSGTLKNLTWRSYEANVASGVGEMGDFLFEPIIANVSELATTMDPIGREISVGEVGIMLPNSEAVRDLLKTYEIVGRQIELYIVSPDLSNWATHGAPYWTGIVKDILAAESEISVTCKTTLDTLKEIACHSRIVNLHVLEAAVDVMTDAGLVADASNGFDAASFAVTETDNSYFYHYTANNVTLSGYHEVTYGMPGGTGADRATHDLPQYGPFYGEGQSSSGSLPGPGQANIKSKDTLLTLLKHTNGCVRIGNTGKLTFVPWKTTRSLSRTFTKEDYYDFEMVAAYGESIINTYLLEIGDGDSKGVIKIKDDAAVTRWSNEFIETYAPDFGINKAIVGRVMLNGGMRGAFNDYWSHGNIDTASDWAARCQDIYDNQRGNPAGNGRGAKNKGDLAWRPLLGDLYGYDIMGFTGTWGFNEAYQSGYTRPTSQSARFGCLTADLSAYWYWPGRRDIWKVNQGPLAPRLPNDWNQRADNGYLTGFTAWNYNGYSTPIAHAYYQVWDPVTGVPSTAECEQPDGEVVEIPIVAHAWAALDVSSIFWDMAEADPYNNPTTWVNNGADGLNPAKCPVEGEQLDAEPIWTPSILVDPDDPSGDAIILSRAWSMYDQDLMGRLDGWLYSDLTVAPNFDQVRQEGNDTHEIEVFDFTQAKDYLDRLLERTANGMPIVRFKTSLRHVDLEIGDFVTFHNDDVFIWERKLPQNSKWEIVSKTVSPLGGDPGITFELAWACFIDIPFTISILITSILNQGSVGESSAGSRIRRVMEDRNAHGLPRLKSPPVIQKIKRTSDDASVLYVGAVKTSSGFGDFPGGLVIWPPTDRPSGVAVVVYYAVDLKTGNLTSAMVNSGVADDQEVSPFPATKFVTIARVECATDGTLGDVESYNQIGGHSEISESTGYDHKYPNYNFTEWAGASSGACLPIGWRLLSVNRKRLDTDYNTFSGGKAAVGLATAESVGAAIICPTKKTRKGGLFGMVIGGIPDETRVGKSSSTHYAYPEKVMLQGPQIAVEQGALYKFEVTAQSPTTGSHFDLNIITYRDDGRTVNTVTKYGSTAFAVADTWETFTAQYSPSGNDRYIGIEFEIKARDKPRTIVDSIKMTKDPATGGAEDWVDLGDTASEIVADKLVAGNSGGTALEQRSLSDHFALELITNDIDFDNSGAGITMFGDGTRYHGIFPHSLSGAYSDDIRVNSYGSVIVNLDSNSNNTAGVADFVVVHKGTYGSVADINHLFTVRGGVGSSKVGQTIIGGAGPATVNDVQIMCMGEIGIIEQGSAPAAAVATGQLYVKNAPDRGLYYKTSSGVGGDVEFDLLQGANTSIGRYTFRAYHQADQTVGASGSTVLDWTVVFNSHETYDSIDTFTGNNTWHAPASGYWRVRAKTTIKNLTAAQAGSGGACLVQYYVEVLNDSGGSGVYHLQVGPLCEGDSSNTFDGNNQCFFEVEGIIPVTKEHQIKIVALDASGVAFDVHGAAGNLGQRISNLEITAAYLT